MRFLAYDPEKHYKQIAQWQESKGRKPIPIFYFPKVGVVAQDFACGFLVRTDTPVCYLEYFIANPKTTQCERKKALTSIASFLCTEAARRGFRFAAMDTKIPTIKEIAREIGFEAQKSEVFHVELFGG